MSHLVGNCQGIVLKLLLIKNIFYRFYAYEYTIELIKNLDLYTLQKFLWRPYKGIGFFIKNYTIYTNDVEKLRELLNSYIDLEYVKYKLFLTCDLS